MNVSKFMFCARMCVHAYNVKYNILLDFEFELAEN